MNSSNSYKDEKINLLSDIFQKLNKMVQLMNDVNNNLEALSENNEKIETFTDTWLPFYSQIAQQEVNEY